jgi:hypothetical protein
MAPRNSDPSRPNPDARLVAELIEGIGRSLALSVEVFLHRGFGTRYIGCGFMGVVLIYLFSMFFPPQEIQPLLLFAALYGLVWLISSIGVLIRYWRGRRNVHSLYTGRPFISSVLPWKESSVKQIEAFGIILFGLGVHLFTRPLGDYLMLAGAFVFLRTYCLAAEQRNMAAQLNDSVIEQQQVADRLQEIQGDTIL